MTRKVLYFFDKLEDRMRGRLSRFPIFYAFLGGVGVVLFWRGVWHTTDFLTEVLLGLPYVTLVGLVDGPLSLLLGTLLLLVTGVFVSAFIGNRLIVSGLYGEKKLTEKTKEEIETEEVQIQKMQETLNRMENKISHIESEIENK